MPRPGKPDAGQFAFTPVLEDRRVRRMRPPGLLMWRTETFSLQTPRRETPKEKQTETNTTGTVRWRGHLDRSKNPAPSKAIPEAVYCTTAAAVITSTLDR